ncbi:hypothetical protein ACD591_06935 [Rufibacter glacialis]|uniref:Uncharacterized protein n=1 Tax=Rufibacter glacialis TaxID=1259555 RepID=A0A5M8QF47_9BACT|nr:hypothetical protein [Rufibacter glacialis]KAA6433386.1 hypothetical protein FOE74_12985 [Rufibacter glacialis]GGK74656.1 hypothetical protein GCM10011405_23400 [Rufibacter glacialis]
MAGALGSKSKPTGPEIIAALRALSIEERETYLLHQLLKEGNGLEFLRLTKRVPLMAISPQGDTLRGFCFPMLDYLAVGGDKDFVRVPLQPKNARTVAEAWTCTLPTRKIVDAIYAAADVKLEPRPLTQHRDSVVTFLEHNQMIQKQLKGKRKGLLLAGHKKDVVLTPRLLRQGQKDRVALYGWHKSEGTPIQPLYLGHTATYTDYSHGIRLLYNRFEVNGQTYTLQELLAHPVLRPLVCDEDICEPIRY